MKNDIKSMLLQELVEYFLLIEEPQFRAEQVFKWLNKGATSFSDMTNLSLELRNKLDKGFFISSPVMLDKLVSESDGTVKYLWQVSDNDTVECVLMHRQHGYTLCISTQVGCKMGCAFCASSIDGYKRDLTASEMLDQVLYSQKDIGQRISNVVLMGIGEPLDNFDNVLRFIKLITHPSGLNIGARHITLSTCGQVENIDKLADYDVQLTLAISLHAPDDETRSQLVPLNNKYNVSCLFDAAGRYFKKTGRRVTFEYVMIDGINDTLNQAELLSKLLKETGSHLNLILLSDVQERKYKASSKERLYGFTGILDKNKINYTVRRSLGTDIKAACGQLRHHRQSAATQQDWFKKNTTEKR